VWRPTLAWSKKWTLRLRVDHSAEDLKDVSNGAHNDQWCGANLPHPSSKVMPGHMRDGSSGDSRALKLEVSVLKKRLCRVEIHFYTRFCFRWSKI
jgi:hypothetical protein